jgi:MoxR-like ATPase
MTEVRAAERIADAEEARWFSEQFDTLAGNVSTFIRGKTKVVRLALTCMLAEGHLLVDDVPGTGKTSMAKAIANSVGGVMQRLQCTPDLLPSDVTGVRIWNSGTGAFEFHRGPVFANVVLADEVNRASPKTQSALLEVMEERQVTVDAVPYAVPRPFVVIATQNPVEHGGTYELPEAQIDRFMVRLSLGYPAHEAEVEVLQNRTRGQTTDDVRPVLRTEDLAKMIDIARRVYLAPSLLGYIVLISAATRRLPDVRLGVSPRGSLALATAAQAHAAADGRPFATADDVKALAPYVLGHRLILRPEAELKGATAEDLLGGIAAGVPVPELRTGT